MKLYILLLLEIESLSLIIYAKFQIFYCTHYIDYIISSEGIIRPINPNTLCRLNRDDNYTFYFNDIKHNLEKPLCLQFVNFHNYNYFSFKYASINEYDIKIINYEDYYYCNNCNIEGTQKNFQVTNTIYEGSPSIFISYYKKNENKESFNNTFCLYATSDISIFYIDESKINQNFYMGKIVKYLLNNEFDYFNINNIFVINGNEDYIFDLNTVSLKIVNITNKKGRIFNEEEELFEGSFFNAKNNHLIIERDNETDEGYLMIIDIITKPRNQKSVKISTCEKEAKIYLNVAQKNCTMNEISNNFCQNCIQDYGKYKNKCYNKFEKLNDLYYNESNKVWSQCETNKNNFTCSICPKGTYRDSLSQLCIKCQKGEYSNSEYKKECEYCPIGYYSDEIGSLNCKKCPDGYTSLLGSDSCYKDCEPGYYPVGDICLPCEPGFYSIGSSSECLECIPGTYTNKEGMGKCLKCKPGTFNNEYKQTTCINCPIGFFSSLSGSTECHKCPIGTFNSLIGNNHCEKCDKGFYNDELGSKECKICRPNYYSDNEGAEICKECKKNKYSLFGYNKCLPCEVTISHCINCSKEGICQKCNNNAIGGFNNCTICENEIDWEFTGENCQLLTTCPKYFYKDKNKNNKIYCIDDVNECPEGMNYLNLNTKQCIENEKVSTKDFINYQLKVKDGGESLNQISHNIFEEINLDDFYKYKKGIKIEGENTKIQIGTEEYFKTENSSDLGIDFQNLKNCMEKIRFNVGIQKNNELIYKVFEMTLDGNKIIDYSVYDTSDLKTSLNLENCQGQKIKIINPLLNNENLNYDDLSYFDKFLNHGTGIYNAYSQIYNDICYSLLELKKYDLSLNIMREYINEYKIPICGEGCEYEGESLKKFQVICYCPIKIDKNEKSTGKLFLIDNMNYFKGNNLKLFKCIKLTFSFEGQKNNLFSEIFIFLFISNICLMIITEINYNENFKDLLIYCKEFIDKKNNKIKKNFQRYIKEKITNNPAIKNSLNLSKTKESFNENNKCCNYYKFLIDSYSKNEIKNFLIEEELINLDYEYYRQIEDRKWYIIFISLFKLNYDFTNTFLIYNNNSSEIYKDYKFNTLKIMIYINSLMVSIFFDLIFYSDNTMHKIYEGNEEYKYNLEYRIPTIFLSNLVNKFITIVLFENLVNFQDEFIKIKNNLNKIGNKEENPNNNISNTYKLEITNVVNRNKNEKEFDIEKSFRKRKIAFYIITILINLSIWYYISCFCSVYTITQKYLLIDYLFNRQMNIINCFIISFLYLIVKLIIKQGEYSFIKDLLNKIIKNDYCQFIIEQIIGFIVMLIIWGFDFKDLFIDYFCVIYLIIIIIILIK